MKKLRLKGIKELAEWKSQFSVNDLGKNMNLGLQSVVNHDLPIGSYFIIFSALFLESL